MEINKLILTKNIKNQLKHLYYISFVKFIAMITIIKWHISIWNKRPIDYGARMCELLFISSGFLVGYNYFKNPMETNYMQSFSYAYKHLKGFYPLYLINTFIDIYIHRKIKINFLSYAEIIFINILMIQSWSRFKLFVPCFNGHTWFLSVLIFCYFVSPLLLKGIKNIKRASIIFLITSLIRISEEELINKGAINLFDADFHFGPVIRLLEFYMGMLTIPVYFFIKNILDKYHNRSTFFKIFFTLIQTGLPIITYKIMLKFNYTLLRCYFALIFSFLILFIGLDYGYFSDIFSSKIVQIIMSFQIEMYLLQLNVNHYINILIKNHSKNKIHNEIEFAFKLIIIFIIAFLYKKNMKDKLSHILDRIVLSLVNKI